MSLAQLPPLSFDDGLEIDLFSIAEDVASSIDPSSPTRTIHTSNSVPAATPASPSPVIGEHKNQQSISVASVAASSTTGSRASSAIEDARTSKPQPDIAQRSAPAAVIERQPEPPSERGPEPSRMAVPEPAKTIAPPKGPPPSIPVQETKAEPRAPSQFLLSSQVYVQPGSKPPVPKQEPQPSAVPEPQLSIQVYKQPVPVSRPNLEPEPEPESKMEPDTDTESDVQSTAAPESEADHDQGPDESSIPMHPIPSMQKAFAESLDEVTHGGAELKPKLRALDVKARREKLLAQDKDEDAFDAIWRYRPGQEQHELHKLVAQISFGVHLLLGGMANDNTQVVTILQGHIDEVDEFLEIALEDLGHAIDDLGHRVDHLKLPMSNMVAFESMLEDRTYRAEVLQGNEKIEHILNRSNVALKQWDDDVDAGLACTTGFVGWLNEQKDGPWRTEWPSLLEIFEAMKGNGDGWLNAFDEMNSRTKDVNELLLQLNTIVSEMERIAGEVSRKTWAKVQPFTAPNGDASPFSSPPSSRFDNHSTPRGSLRSGSASTVQMNKARSPFDEYDGHEYPLPGAAPLLPPPRNSGRPGMGFPGPPPRALGRPSTSHASSPRQSQASGKPRDSSRGVEDDSIFILQPRTYTPQPPEPMPSPRLQPAPSFTQNEHGLRNSQSSNLQKRPSLRDRVSLKVQPPGAIQIPPRSSRAETPSYRPSTGHSTPRTSHSHAPDSTYGSDRDSYHIRHGSGAGSGSDLSPPVRPSLMPSPHSDHNQYYRPVRASPHSPLQQRPHTAVPGDHRPSTQFYPAHQRQQPSRVGALSTLSTVTTNTHQTRPKTPGGATVRTTRTKGDDKTLKKKKSAFGWFKKAFAMDEDEKAMYEARKAMQQPQEYYDPNAPIWLDGRRIR